MAPSTGSWRLSVLQAGNEHRYFRVQVVHIQGYVMFYSTSVGDLKAPE